MALQIAQDPAADEVLANDPLLGRGRFAGADPDHAAFVLRRCEDD
ncbi:hypothetical protein [Branchiibius sp. NY16-3462-2]|nr:hypothetical protein [Branchiibius sp. NY16-3462-2]